MSPIRSSAALAFLSLGLTSGALAHPRLVASTPAANATVRPPARIELRFSERLVPQFSRATLTMTANASRARPPAVRLRTGISRDHMTLVITPQTALVPGAYRISWHAVSVDTHRVEGSLSFRVG